MKRPFKGPGIAGRVIAAGLVITVLFVGATFLWMLPSAERALVGRKKEKIREATEIAWSVLEFYHKQELSGELTREAARDAASRMVEQIRFGPEMKDYFWINDTLPRMVMHPYRTDLNGTDVSGFKDPDGKAVFSEFADIAVRHGEGFVDYLWQWQDDSDRIVPKISFVRLFRPWGWVLGTGMYIEDVRAEIGRWKVGIVILYGLLAVVGAVLSGLVGKQVALAVRTGGPAAAGGAAADRDVDDGRSGAAVSLRTFILAVMIPLLLGLTVYWSLDLYRRLYGIILEGFDARLYGVSSTTGIFIAGADHAQIEKTQDEDDPLYRKYVAPMRRIWERTGLTYLYTQILEDRSSNCVYLIDATPGEEHSAIGTRDELDPADYNAALKVLLHGVVHISDVDHTENWGMLKYAYAPIWNADGTVRAIAGADVNIGAIRLKTRTALFAVFVMAVLALALGAYFSLLISGSLTRPIEQLKRWALKVAAGSYKDTIAIDHPVELKSLARDFGTVGAAMERTMTELRQDYRTLRDGEVAYKLVQLLEQPDTGGLRREGPYGVFSAFFANLPGAGKTPSGMYDGAAQAVCWVAGAASDPLEAVRTRSDIRETVRKQDAAGTFDPAALLSTHAGTISAVAVWSRTDGRVRIWTNQPFTYVMFTDGRPQSMRVRGGCAGEALPADADLVFRDAAALPAGTTPEPADGTDADAYIRNLTMLACGAGCQIFTGVFHAADAG